MTPRLPVRGIYVQQQTAQNPKKLRQLINNAQAVGLNTFVVDLWSRSPRYKTAIRTILEAGIRYVPRVTLFPHGGSREQVANRALWEKRWQLVEYAIGLGAKDVQLDYIRFSSKNSASPENAKKIQEVVRFFRQRIAARGARLQIDIFGEVAHAPSTRIGQDIGLLAPDLDAVCPMLYPSHFEPYVERAKTPYKTVYGALAALAKQTKGHDLPVFAYIEPFNYRYRMSDEQRIEYLRAQLEAVEDAGAQGYYVWSVGNYYDLLFELLRRRKTERDALAPPAAPRRAAGSGPTSPGAHGP
jgi:hypothetical protein